MVAKFAIAQFNTSPSLRFPIFALTHVRAYEFTTMTQKFTRFRDIPEFIKSGSYECDYDIRGLWRYMQTCVIESGLILRDRCADAGSGGRVACSRPKREHVEPDVESQYHSNMPTLRDGMPLAAARQLRAARLR